MMNRKIEKIIRTSLAALMLVLPLYNELNASSIKVEAATKKYFGIEELDTRLEDVLQGDIPITDKHGNPVSSALGSEEYKNDAIYGSQYVYKFKGATTYSGSSCWIYAICVYYCLFGDVPGCVHSNSADITIKNKISYETLEQLKKNGLFPGSYFRVGNHSFIYLGHDNYGITILDANGNGNGLVQLRTVSYKKLSGSLSKTISKVVSPKAGYIESFRKVRIVNASKTVKANGLFKKTVSVNISLNNEYTNKQTVYIYLFDSKGDVISSQYVSVSGRSCLSKTIIFSVSNAQAKKISKVQIWHGNKKYTVK